MPTIISDIAMIDLQIGRMVTWLQPSMVDVIFNVVKL